MLISSSATPAAKLRAVVADRSSPRSSWSLLRAARWQQLTNTSSGTMRMLRISRGPEECAVATARRRAGRRPLRLRRPLRRRTDASPAARRGRRCARCASRVRSSALMTVRASGAGCWRRSGDQRCTLGASSARGGDQRIAHRLGLARAPRQRADSCSGRTAGSPITSTSLRCRRRSPAARNRACAACAAAWCGSPRARSSPLPPCVSVSSISQGMPAVPASSSMQHLGACRRETAPSPPAPAAGTACGRSAGRWLRSFERRRTSSRTSARLRRLRAHLGARALGVERVGDLRRRRAFAVVCTSALMKS